MTSPDHDELARREQDLRQREMELRLRELEIEVHQSKSNSSSQSVVAEPSPMPRTKLQRWMRNMVRVGKFLLVVVVTIAAVKIALWLSMAVLVLGVAWLAYQIFFDTSHS